MFEFKLVFDKPERDLMDKAFKEEGKIFLDVKSKTGLYCELPLALARAAMEKLKTDKNIFKFLVQQITGDAYGRPRS